METGKTLHGGVNLVFDTTHAVTHIAEGMYRNIAATSWLLGREPEGPAPGMAGFVHEAIRRINGAARHASNAVLRPVAAELDYRSLPGPYREAAICALNGICGDHLERSGNPLAIPMQLRVLLPPTPDSGHAVSTPARSGRLAGLLELDKRSVEIYPQPDALADHTFSPGRKLLVILHGLSMSEREWTARQHNHAETLAREGDYTPIYVLYNSGRNISRNGRELSEQLAGLLAAWPTDVQSITFMGFSMGGLVARSAMHIAEHENHDWLARVRKAVYIGTPHHGAVMERGGFWLQKSMTYSPYTSPLSALGRIRSAGITDLRHGNVRDDDWLHHDEHEDHSDRRRPTPLAGGIEHYAMAATLSKRPGDRIGRLLGDGLVHPSSATGRHKCPTHHLAFPQENTRIFYHLGHLAMLHDARV
ncbi:MAG: esterase/lipase family protein, partial [Halioglobus sp.]